MDLKSTFETSLISFGSHNKPEDFLGSFFQYHTPGDTPLLRLLSGGRLLAESPFSFDIAGLPCHMMLYTRKGCGKLIRSRQVYTLDETSFLFLDCQERFRIDIASAPWQYDVIFVAGRDLPWYSRQVPGEEPALLSLPPCSEIILCMEQLLSLENPLSPSLSFTVSGLLHHMAAISVSACLKSSPEGKLPSYLYSIRELFDNGFEESYSLEALAHRFHISKYRLCREFGAAFGCSPIQYLNRRRIQMASHLLLTTNLKVHEIGNRVGIPNTNHFITLFKKHMLATPLEYRQRMTPQPSAVHGN